MGLGVSGRQEDALNAGRHGLRVATPNPACALLRQDPLLHQLLYHVTGAIKR
jgi:hypothetical protein